jgi:hypothetical protein
MQVFSPIKAAAGVALVAIGVLVTLVIFGHGSPSSAAHVQVLAPATVSS